MSFFKRTIASMFERKAEVELPRTVFTAYLVERYGRKTAVKVIDAFQKLKLPLPEENGQFMEGPIGALVFLNRYGVVLRIDQTNLKRVYAMHDERILGQQGLQADRINNDPWIVKPIASMNLGEVTIELCPAYPQETNPDSKQQLIDRLKSRGIEFWDDKFSNIARMPIQTPSFPDGVPIVIDRGAVRWLTSRTNVIGRALNAMQQKKLNEEVAEIEAAQETLYAPLREAFKTDIEQFWMLCERYTQERKHINGWNAPQPEIAKKEKCAFGDNKKTPRAAEVARSYDLMWRQKK